MNLHNLLYFAGGVALGALVLGVQHLVLRRLHRHPPHRKCSLHCERNQVVDVTESARRYLRRMP